MFKESTADVLRWVLHVPLQQPWTGTSKSERQIYAPIFPTDFFPKLFRKQVIISSVLHPLIRTVPTCHYYLSAMSFYTDTNRADEANMHKHTYTHTECTETQTFPTTTSRAMHAHSASGGHTQNPPGKAERLSSIGRHAIIHTHAWSPALRHTCTPAFTYSPSTHTAVLEQFPHTDLWC